MPLKNQLPTLSKLYSIYEETPEVLLDEADIDSYFYHRVLNITKKQNRLVLLTKHRTAIPSTLKFLNSTAPQYNKNVPSAKKIFWQDENWE